MRTLLKSLLTATAFLILVPTTASARPEDCEELCTDVQNVPCSVQCLWLGRIMTCGDYGFGYCTGAHAEPSSVTLDEGSRYEAASQVCSEEQPALTES
ncbi:hypothetical protein ACLESO_30700 [Pyxidicoccus sp. 3LG]